MSVRVGGRTDIRRAKGKRTGAPGQKAGRKERKGKEI